jgi:hypothetical protein
MIYPGFHPPDTSERRAHAREGILHTHPFIPYMRNWNVQKAMCLKFGLPSKKILIFVLYVLCVHLQIPSHYRHNTWNAHVSTYGAGEGVAV